MDTETIRLAGSVSSHVGYVRTNNEDNFLLQGRINEDSGAVIELAPALSPTLAQWHCFAVFDGMGGGENGEIASWLAAEAFRGLAAGGPLERVDVDLLARTGFWDANRRIILRRDPAMYGTTGTVVFTDGDRFRVYHLGDSRAYLFRLGALHQITKDQTVAAMKIESGVYDPGAPQAGLEKHQLTEYIGCDPTMQELKPQESMWLTFLPGDRLLLCSDGLYDMCPDSEIRELMTRYREPVEASWKLVEQALRSGGRDNVTCMVVGR